MSSIMPWKCSKTVKRKTVERTVVVRGRVAAFRAVIS